VASNSPYHQLRVCEVIDETSDAKSIVLEVPAALAESFTYEAGQFLTFRVCVGEERLVRCYSLASSPVTDSRHKVTVKRVEGGRVSNWMNDRVEAGSELEVMKPAGVFCLRSASSKLILFSGGSGITPVISIIKTALETTQRPVKLVYANRDAESVIFAAELDALRADHPGRLEVVHRLDDSHGFVTAELVEQQIGPDSDADFYTCGPGPFMDVVEETLGRLGVGAEQIFIERFVSDEVADAPRPAPAPLESAGTEAARVVSVTLEGETRELTLEPGETILQAVRREGMDPPFACEDAYCGCCMARVLEGKVEMLRNDGGIDAGQIAEGWVLTCQGIPASQNCRVEYPD
jgi:3-ketosteroid 9alpha-monooxygenase subunit B